MAEASRSRRETQRAAIRGDLLDAAQSLVREDGYEGLTIRRLAARVGYAPMSVYSYFPDKHAILVALARDAFDSLAQRMREQDSAEPMEALRHTLRAYVAFGLDNPQEYRTVFMSADAADTTAQSAAALYRENPALGELLARAQDCVEAGLLRGDAIDVATLLWTVLHGAVALLITFPHSTLGDREVHVERCIEMAIAGLRSERTAGGG